MPKGHTISTLKSRISLVLRRFHDTPLDLYSYFISNGRMDLLRRSKVLRTSAVMAVFLLVLLTSAVLVPLYNKLEVTEAATGTAKESSLSFNLTNSTASVDLSVNDANGTFASSGDDNSKVKFNISTTNYTGYTLSIKGTNNNQTLVNSTNSGYTLSSISTATESFNSTDYNNKWGYLPSKLNSSTNSKYQPAPTTSATTLNKTDYANGSSTCNGNNGVSGGDAYTIGIGARASYTTPAGEYTGTYILTAVGNPINYTVTYNKNTTDTVSSLPSNVSSSTSQTYITLSNNTPSREGYTFLGWCLGTITTTSNVDSCTGTTYQPGNSFYIDQESANLPTLLAMWEKDIQTIASFTYMQDVTTEACNATIVGITTTVKDSRDNTAYTIGKLADGNCWLLDNLALDLATYKNNLSTINTNASEAELTHLRSGDGTILDQYPTSGVRLWPSGTNYNFSYSVPYVYAELKNATGTGWYTPGKYGVYYNYCAASAGTYCYGDGHNSASIPSGNITDDICASGWGIPTTNEYKNLYDTYGGATFVDALHIPRSGYYYNGAGSGQDSTAYFWTTDYNGPTHMNIFYVYGSVGGYTTMYARTYGLSVRCMLKDTVVAGAYMQDATSDMLNKMNPNDVTTMKDTRDDREYAVSKLADGRLWLVDDLALDLTNTAVQAKLNATTTNATNTILNYLKNGGGVGQYATYAVEGFSSTPYYDRPYINTDFIDTVIGLGIGAGYSLAKYGAYYNYCAATAGSYCYADGAGVGDAQYDICPKGWHMPTGGVGGEYEVAYNAYSQQYGNFVYAMRLPLAGYYYAGSPNNSEHSNGYFWSSTYYGGNYMKILSLNTRYIYPTDHNARVFGFPVRCIFNGQ